MSDVVTADLSNSQNISSASTFIEILTTRRLFPALLSEKYRSLRWYMNVICNQELEEVLFDLDSFKSDTILLCIKVRN